MSEGLDEKASKDALAHVLKVLKKTKYKYVLEEVGVEDIFDFMTLQVEDLRGETGFDENGDVVRLNMVDIARLRRIQQWYLDQNDRTLNAWYSLTDEELQKYVSTKPTTVSLPDQVTFSQPVGVQVANSVTSNSTTESMLPGVKKKHF